MELPLRQFRWRLGILRWRWAQVTTVTTVTIVTAAHIHSIADTNIDIAAPLGQHLIAEFHGVEAELLCDAEKIAALLQEAAIAAGAHVLQTMFHGFGLRRGVTGVVMLAESHISIHTWPEYGYAAADIFMCGSADPQLAYAALQRALMPKRSTVSVLARGAGLLRR